MHTAQTSPLILLPYLHPYFCSLVVAGIYGVCLLNQSSTPEPANKTQVGNVVPGSQTQVQGPKVVEPKNSQLSPKTQEIKEPVEPSKNEKPLKAKVIKARSKVSSGAMKTHKMITRSQAAKKE